MSKPPSFTVVNPTTGEQGKTYDGLTDEAVRRRIEDVHAVWKDWSRTAPALRAEPLVRAARILKDRADPYAALMATEMGKPLAEGRSEIEKCAWVCEYFAEHAEAFLAPQEIETDARRSWIAHRPLGVVLAVMPWNFPFWQVFRFLAPAVMAGNAGVLKHASNVPGCALAIEDVVREAGFPENLFRTLLVESSQVDAILENPRIAAATLTGSTPAGRAVAGKAGAMLKKTVLELGGSDPYLILEDADLDEAAEACAKSRLINSGQSCIAAKRFLVVDSVYDDFLERFVARVRARVVGDPFEEGTDVGPQARVDLRDDLDDQVRRSIGAGARVVLGGEVPDRPGAFYPPTVLVDVSAESPAYREELFGPVAAVIRVADEGEAIRVANDTVFGLGAAVFTRDVRRGTRIAEEELDAGCCFVNAFVKSDPRLPFGGIKESGYGRELSALGIREFVNRKTVYVA